MPTAPASERRNTVREALACCRPHFVAAAAFSAVSNLLYLAPSLYMIQVYDRVVPTGGLVTLAAISLIALVAIATLNLLEWLRARLLIRAGARLEAALAERTLGVVMSRPSLGRQDRADAIRDFDTLRQGIASPGIIAAFDAPWAPIYMIVAFLLHPALGLLTLVSSIVLLALAWSNERATADPVRIAGDAANKAYASQLHTSAHAAEVRALGMGSALARRQLLERQDANRLQAQAGFAGSNHAGLVKFLRLVLQSAALGLGALLVVSGSISGGAMLAASLLLSRALAPIEQIVGAWRPILQSRLAYARLVALFQDDRARPHTHLPTPSGALQVERVTVLTPLNERVALAELNFEVAAGEIVGVVGPSGAGKSTLLRTLAGASQPARGHIRLDGASTADWDGERLARHIGYLPQSFVLFSGTVKDNISRFRGVLDGESPALDAAVIAAARAIDAHEMILRLPQGYDTPIGSGHIGLSSGQMQRIAIARALFGDPRIVILDEPTAHLDAEAQHAFLKTLTRLRADGVTAIFATHSGDILAATDKLLLLNAGRIERFAPLAEAVPTLRKPVAHMPVKVKP